VAPAPGHQPFDQPMSNRQGVGAQVVGQYKSQGALPRSTPLSGDGMTVYGNIAAAGPLRRCALFCRGATGDYVGLQAYLTPTPPPMLPCWPCARGCAKTCAWRRRWATGHVSAFDWPATQGDAGHGWLSSLRQTMRTMRPSRRSGCARLVHDLGVLKAAQAAGDRQALLLSAPRHPLPPRPRRDRRPWSPDRSLQ